MYCSGNHIASTIAGEMHAIRMRVPGLFREKVLFKALVGTWARRMGKCAGRNDD